jgi:predicted DNA-binding ribbon-helix-helix protein
MASALPGPALVSGDDSRPEKHSALVMRNISVRGRRTSIRLEPLIWNILSEICHREFCTPHDVCSYVVERKPPGASLTSSLRVFILDYFHKSSNEDGHRAAGHGQGMFISQQQERREMRAIKADRPELRFPNDLQRNPQGDKSGPGPA